MDYREIEFSIGNAKFKYTIDYSAAFPSSSHSHAHTNFELFYVWDGEVKIKTDDEEYVIGKGQSMLIAPALYHRSFSKEGTKKLNLYFSFVKSQKKNTEEDLYKNFERVFSKTVIEKNDNAEQIGKHLFAFRKTFESECVGKSERLRAELTEVIFALYDFLSARFPQNEAVHSESGATMHYRYEIDTLLAQNYTNNIDLEFLSKELCLSPKRVGVIIKQLYGKSFREVKAEMKIQVAKQLLRETEKTIEEIAKNVGYGSVRGFLAAFLQMTGKTPSVYRKEKLEKGEKI